MSFKSILLVVTVAFIPYFAYANTLNQELTQEAINFTTSIWPKVSNDDSNFTFANTTVGDTVVSYGRTITHAQFMQEQFDFAKRWPQRLYQLQPGSLNVTCDDATLSCHATGIITWDVESQPRNAKSVGTASFDYQLFYTNGNFIITSESGAVISRTQSTLSADNSPAPTDPQMQPQVAVPQYMPQQLTPQEQQEVPPAPPPSSWYHINQETAVCVDGMTPIVMAGMIRQEGFVPDVSINRDDNGNVVSVVINFTNSNGEKEAASFFKSLSDCQTFLQEQIAGGQVVNPNDLK